MTKSKASLAGTLAVLLVPLMGGPSRAADGPASAVGFWTTGDHGGVVQIAPCGDNLCGQLVGLRPHPPGEYPRDTKNPDAAKRNDPICGLMLMGSMKPDGDKAGKWTDGWVYDPDGGSTYSGEMHLDGADTLKLRGYIGVSLFGRTETWTREPADGPHNRCEKPPAG